MENFWILISSSTVISAIVSCIASHLLNIYTQNRAYRNDYYKNIINKRFETYQHIDNIICALKSTMVDNDGKGCHSMFTNDSKEYYKVILCLHNALTNSMWLTDEMFNVLKNLNQAFLDISYSITDDKAANIKIGKENYSKLGKLRTEIENQFKTDLLDMSNVSRFMKKKTKLKTLNYEIPAPK